MMNLLLFNINSYKFGIETKHIRKIKKIEKIDPVPGNMENILGIINFQGDIVTVLNIQNMLQGSRVELPCTLLLLGFEDKRFAIIVNSIIDVIKNIDESNLKRIDLKFFNFLLNYSNRQFIIVDIEKLHSTETVFTDDELKKLDGIFK